VEAERRASRQDRLAAMGTLAAGLAHEINSPLAGAINGVEVLRDQPEPAKAERYGELVDTALKRISGLVNRMLQLAPARPEGGECELEVVVDDLKDFVASRLQQHRFTTELSSTPLRLQVAAGDLFPVLLNLVGNALDSLDQLPQEQSGLVTLSATSEEGQVIICLRDNGPGAAPEILEHLFEPFVTDKDVGTGTGLGMALAHATVRSLGGSIEADNLESGGFEVVLRLPQA
jgi:C4-dicarboxylate-specific signal transduction histidine kinase